jgi:asparagine synthase (glutamine-hydrolysing)
VFLSAGVDSTVLAALAAEVGGRLRTVTLGFSEYRGTPHDETRVAEAVAKQLGTDHQTIWVTRADFVAAREHLLERMDQPSIDGVNSYFVARAAKEAGLKVALSGLGGDELFAGYSDYREIPRIVGLVSKMPSSGRLGRVLRRFVSPIVSRITSPKYSSVMEYGGDFAGAYMLRRALYLPWELRPILSAGSQTSEHELSIMRRVIERDLTGCAPTAIVAALESAWYMRNQLLRDADWASMSHSVEVRVPLVDWTLWRTVAPLGVIEPGAGKRALAGTTSQRLSGEILSRPKTGFTVPMRSWMLERRNPRYSERGLRGWARYVYGKTANGESSGVSDGCIRGPGGDRAVQSRSAHELVRQ